MDMRTRNDIPLTTETLDPALRITVEHLLADTVKQPCYRNLCRNNQAAPDVVYRLIDGLSGQLRAKDELIKSQSRTIERLRFQLVELIKECSSREGEPGLQ